MRGIEVLRAISMKWRSCGRDGQLLATKLTSDSIYIRNLSLFFFVYVIMSVVKPCPTLLAIAEVVRR
jgi:hypothetical protein